MKSSLGQHKPAAPGPRRCLPEWGRGARAEEPARLTGRLHTHMEGQQVSKFIDDMGARTLTAGAERPKYPKEERLGKTTWYWIRVENIRMTCLTVFSCLDRCIQG